MRFGKHPPKHDYRTLRFSNYALPLAPPPPQLDLLAKVTGTISTLFPMDGNDQYGDCTIAALAHASTLWHALAGKHTIPTKASVVKTYFKLSGGIDSGLAELDVLNYWRQHSVGSEKILAYVSVNPKNHDNVKNAISIFGGLYIGFQCQENVLADFGKRPWQPGKLTNDGHAVHVCGYDGVNVNVLTWGATQLGSWDWWDECVDECYAIIPAEATAFSGFDLATLKADLSQLV